MTTTPVLGATELVASQAIPEQTVNEQLRRAEQGAQHFSVKDKDLDTPPGSPADGDAYIVATSGTGAWSGKDKAIAYYQTGTGWLFITPREGMYADVNDEDTLYRYSGSAWGSFTGGGGGGGSGSAWNVQWSPFDNEPPASNYATLGTRNSHPYLAFDTTTQEAAVFSGVLPADYAGAGVTVDLWCSLTSATSGTVGWDVAFERMNASSLDIDADSFGSATTVTATTVPGTSGQLLKMSVNVSDGANMDSLAAGEMFRLRIRRDVANDTASGDAELLRVMLVSQ